MYITFSIFHLYIVLAFPKLAFPFLYLYYLDLFLAYHVYYNFTKRFFLRTKVVINGYLKLYEYNKLILWLFFVFLPTLLKDLFVFSIIFTPLLGVAIYRNNLVLLFFLIVMWLWLVFLVMCNKHKICTRLLTTIKFFFSRRACLHFIGNATGKKIAEKLGNNVLVPTIIISAGLETDEKEEDKQKKLLKKFI